MSVQLVSPSKSELFCSQDRITTTKSDVMSFRHFWTPAFSLNLLYHLRREGYSQPDLMIASLCKWSTDYGRI